MFHFEQLRFFRDADTGFPMTEAEKVHSDDQRRIGQENAYKMIKESIVVEKKNWNSVIGPIKEDENKQRVCCGSSGFTRRNTF